MGFTDLCIYNLKRLSEGRINLFSGNNYFTLSQIKSLPDIIRENKAIEDLVITPYYIFNNKVMELYDYTLSIRLVESVQKKEKFFLEETGKNSVYEIEKNIIQKLDNTFYEVLNGDEQTFTKNLNRYIQFMIDNEPKLLTMLREETNEEIKSDGIFYELI